MAEHTFVPLADAILACWGAEHGDEILLGELGLDTDALLDLKVRGVVA